ISVASMRTVVVLPAPFGPRKPKTSPAETCRVRLSTATTPLNCFVRLLASIIFFFPNYPLKVAAVVQFVPCHLWPHRRRRLRGSAVGCRRCRRRRFGAQPPDYQQAEQHDHGERRFGGIG